jgi:CubicO group peptidase (beta-lactamase class C family)
VLNRSSRLIALLVVTIPAWTLSAGSRAEVDSLVRRLMAAGEVPGLSMAVIHRGKIGWSAAYGLANSDTRTPMTGSTLLEAASLSKPVFAYAVLKLVDAGVLELDVPLQRYLPEAATDERMKLVTARMVLSHTTGLQNEVMPGQTPAIHFDPGSRFSYSGAGFLYLQRVVEHVTGKKLAPLMEELVFVPLRMHDSRYVWTADSDARQAFGHTAAGTVAERRRPATGTVATLSTTPRDYARFIAAVMKGTGLRRATATAMLTTQTAVDEGCTQCLSGTAGRMSAPLSWGLGFGLERTGRGKAFWHWGENNGEFQNFVMAYPDGDAVVIFTNSGNGFSIMPKLVTAVLGGDHAAFAWMRYEHYDSPAKLLLREIRARGATVALAGTAMRNLTESQLNSMGYVLLQRGSVADAVTVFEQNVERFPGSANAYDSLGEAYAAAGDPGKAIASYERSLELDPMNTNAVDWLHKLRAPPALR